MARSQRTTGRNRKSTQRPRRGERVQNGKNGKQVDREIYVLQSRICKAFANPIRLELLDLLAERDWFASELQERLDISNPNLSQHLAVLRSAGVVSTRRQGKQLLCSLAMPQVKSACKIIRDVLRTQINSRHSLAV
jgi:DNA-binding transcriptional ArsR family regulator